jgi:hypothetical protein
MRPVPLVLDLRIAHDRFDSTSDPSLNGNLHYPTDLDGPLNEAVTDKRRQYHTDHNNRPSNDISFMSAMATTSGSLHSEFVLLLFLRIIGKLTAFLQIQKFILWKPTVDSSTTAACRSLHNSSLRSETSSPRMEHYGLS